ncbi:ABC transporter substrate-binding protein [Propionimicrobium sp. PCR01-08-3]|uniref:ABC transporter substrate-binding protein n=1 Tax=Propionimicrobium sp. PCR01-08-3 TaxID=3052086 RepID=UPI00255C9E34|nr:ABC transporter substrate-binding protein [Propionimicrobium sp. PCR01-08-3]WIY82413.1 ABC transporter substrate-binding protein [Propionimicrobium sp. PCR01-08-3]
MSRKFVRPLAVSSAVVLALGMAACGGGDDGGSGSSESVDCSAFDAYGDLSGTEVSVYTAIVSPESDPYVESFKAFEECTGATINYEGDKAFSEQISVRVQGGNAPDIAFVPQPGLVQTLVDTGNAVPAPADTEANVDQYFSEDWKKYGTVDDTFYAAPLGASVKSLVWYSPSAFADGGYEVPETWDQMMDLTQQIASDHNDGLTKPWCVGFGDGASTGWVGTDWIEDVMLRTSDGDTYDKWVNHDIPFNDSSVVTAFDTAGDILKNNDYVNGGLGDATTISTTAFTDAGLPILDGTCFMHRQASFYGNSWPEGTNVGPDGDVWAFYLPATDPDQAKPVIGGGDFALAFSDRPEVQAFQTYLSSADWANERAKATTSGGAVTANTGLDQSLLTNEVDKLSVELLTDENAVFRFDGSDLMPSAVGSGTFWTAMVDWTTSGASTEQVTDQVESTWPA